MEKEYTEMKTLIQGLKVQHKTLFIFYKIKILVKYGISAIYGTIISEKKYTEISQVIPLLLNGY